MCDGWTLFFIVRIGGYVLVLLVMVVLAVLESRKGR